MEDGASWVVREEGSFWVYVKPAAHYNFLEWRFKQNPICLKRCLEYARKPEEEKEKRFSGPSIRVDVSEFSLPKSVSFGKLDKVSVFMAVCESLSQKEFRPLLVRLVQVPLSPKSGQADQLPRIVFSNVKQSFEKLVLLFMVRASHPDISGLRHKNDEALTPALTWKACFGLLPVGSPVYWAAYSMSSKTTKVSQLPLQMGIVTIASLSMWDGCTSKSCDMLLIVPGGHEKDVPKISINVKTIPREQPSASGAPRPLGPGGYFNGQRDSTGGKQIRPSVDIEKCVTFRYIYGNQQQKSVQEITQNFGCPLCRLECASFTGLKHHLTSSHDLLTFTEEHSASPTLWVRCRPGIYDRNGDVHCCETHALASSQEKVFYLNRRGHRHGQMDTEEHGSGQAMLDEGTAGAWKPLAAPSRRPMTQAKGNCVGGKGSSQPKKISSSCLRVRRTFQPHEFYQTFYHSTSALRMTADEALASTDTDDNEDELDWELQTLRDMGNRKLATSEEKHFMFMWSRALRACCLGFADYKMPDMCYRFTIDHREFLRKEEYRMSFAFHLSNLFNFRLIPPDVVSNCLKAVEDDSFYEKLKEEYAENNLLQKTDPSVKSNCALDNPLHTSNGDSMEIDLLERPGTDAEMMDVYQ